MCLLTWPEVSPFLSLDLSGGPITINISSLIANPSDGKHLHTQDTSWILHSDFDYRAVVS